MSKFFDTTKKRFDSTFSPAKYAEDKANESIESQWEKTKAHREHWEAVAKRQREMGCTPLLIEQSERIAKLTHWEYELEGRKQYKLWKEKRDEYIRENPMKESVVEELYSRFDAIMKRFDEMSNTDGEMLCYGSWLVWLDELNPTDIMSSEDLTFVYEPIVESLHEQFLEKHGK